MRFFGSCLSCLVLCVVYWQVSAGDSTNVTQRSKRPKENEKHKLPVVRSPEFVSIKKLLPRNSTSLKNVTSGIAPRSNKTTGDSKLHPESDKNLQVENGTFDPFKPLFLFPILPFLFPPKDEGFISPEENGTRTLSKTFTFFDFAFPLNERVNDSKIINVKKLTADKAESKKKNRKRRTSKRAVPDFIEDAPMFPDSELDEFLPKPDLFFPDLSFHPKPVKLSRRKRDEKKPDVKNDFKVILNAFDEAFTRTEKELERVDPILNFIKGMESSFGEEKKGADDFFKDLSGGKVQRNVREHPDGLSKNPDTPVIIVNKVVKIGEFRCRNDKLDAKKSKRKKKKESDLKLKFLGGGGKTEETTKKNFFERFQQEQPHERKLWKRSHHGNPKERRHIHTSLEANEMRILPRNVSSGRNTTEENGKTEKSLKVDLLKESEGREGVKRETSEEKRRGRKPSYDDLKKNITEVLKKFLKRSEEAGSSEERGRGLQEEEEEEGGAFDWTEKEILDSLGIRRKKDAEFPLEYVDDEEKERPIVDLDFLFLSVTLPTMLVFTLVLLVCFLSLRVKGKFCAKLFSPRNVYVTEEDVHPTSKAATTEAKARES